MKLAILFSGGKDSTMTVYKALKEGHTVKYLLSLVSENPASYMFHYPNINLTKVQAELMNIPIITKATKGEKEKELDDLKEIISSIKNEIDGVGAGALASKYQYDRVSKICSDLELKTYTPCWQEDDEVHWKEILNSNFEVVITGIAAEGFDSKWLGRKIDKKALEDLKTLKEKYKIHMGLEGGEGESFVSDCPLFKKKIQILESEKIIENKCTGQLIIKKIELLNK